MTKIVFIHGFLGSPSDWDFARNGLFQYDTHALEIPLAENWSAGLLLLGEMIEPGTVVVGYSMGARLALGYALSCPERVKGIVFVSGNPGLDD